MRGDRFKVLGGITNRHFFLGYPSP
jgi:hypothetical protein